VSGASQTCRRCDQQAGQQRMDMGFHGEFFTGFS
jgi:hypothetical protein